MTFSATEQVCPEAGIFISRFKVDIVTIALVVTTIQAPNAVMEALAMQARTTQAHFYVFGDRKSPPTYSLAGAEYFSLPDQHERFGSFSKALPTGHYARKNLGYLAALDAGADWIVETDDDNYPLNNFLEPPAKRLRCRQLRSSQPWVNAYRHFGPNLPVWPRGFPLENLAGEEMAKTAIEWAEETPAIVQGLADDNPDVDAVYRLTRPLPVRFDPQSAPLSLARGNWCPFNSQNTWIHRDVAVLSYLPAYCSFRMTDIWRSFVAQRCLWEMGRRLVFVAPTVRQERNEHDLMRDFADEVSGYLKNDAIRRCLEGCVLTGQPLEDLPRCYEALIQAAIFPSEEAELVQAWIAEIARRIE